MLISNILKTGKSRIYCWLIALRVISAFAGLGYIHPDEYFQNGEVTAGAVFKWHHLRTWEWDPTFPCRSILPPFLTTGLPLAIMSILFADNVPGWLVFLVERLSMLLLSFALDLCVVQLVPISRIQPLLLLASSHVVMTFQVRPFSNSIEACLVALAMAILGRMLSAKQYNHTVSITTFASQASWLAIILVVGIMTRITFAAFALPIAVQALLLSLRFRGPLTIGHWVQCFTMPFFVGVTALGCAIAVDSFYFTGRVTQVVLTPYNNLLYNLSPDNLAKHGLHPRWLHIVVNLPLIIGPGLIVYGLLAARRVYIQAQPDKSQNFLVVINRTCIGVILLSLALLSLQPHQEPRFLTPLLVPFVVLVANSGYLKTARRLFWVTWIIGNMALSLVFGVLHQGGVVPSLLHLNNLISPTNSSGDYAVVYWKTYMPPWHLLGIPESEIVEGHASVTDLAGMQPAKVEDYLISLRNQRLASTVLYLVTPEAAMRSLVQPIAQCFTLNTRIYPHLDLDHIPESIRTGWPGGISLGVYVADSDCLGS